MRFCLLLALGVWLIPQSTYAQKIAWDASSDPSVTAYIITIDEQQKGTTSTLTFPFSPTANQHRVCVSAQNEFGVSEPACVIYTAPSLPSWICTIPATVKRYANGDKQYTFRCPPDTPFLRGDTVKTSK